MTGTEILAVAAAILVAMLGGAFVAALVVLVRSVRELAVALEDFTADSEALVDEMRASIRHASAQVDRVDRLVTAAEGLESRVEGASRLAQRTLQSPVVKAMAFSAGVSRAGQRLRFGTDLSARRRRKRKAS